MSATASGHFSAATPATTPSSRDHEGLPIIPQVRVPEETLGAPPSTTMFIPGIPETPPPKSNALGLFDAGAELPPSVAEALARVARVSAEAAAKPLRGRLAQARAALARNDDVELESLLHDFVATLDRTPAISERRALFDSGWVALCIDVVMAAAPGSGHHPRAPPPRSLAHRDGTCKEAWRVLEAAGHVRSSGAAAGELVAEFDVVVRGVEDMDMIRVAVQEGERNPLRAGGQCQLSALTWLARAADRERFADALLRAGAHTQCLQLLQHGAKQVANPDTQLKLVLRAEDVLCALAVSRPRELAVGAEDACKKYLQRGLKREDNATFLVAMNAGRILIRAVGGQDRPNFITKNEGVVDKLGDVLAGALRTGAPSFWHRGQEWTLADLALDFQRLSQSEVNQRLVKGAVDDLVRAVRLYGRWDSLLTSRIVDTLLNLVFSHEARFAVVARAKDIREIDFVTEENNYSRNDVLSFQNLLDILMGTSASFKASMEASQAASGGGGSSSALTSRAAGKGAATRRGSLITDALAAVRRPSHLLGGGVKALVGGRLDAGAAAYMTRGASNPEAAASATPAQADASGGWVMISYNHASGELAKVLNYELRARGYRTWIDFERILTGDNLNDAMADAVQCASVVVALVSRAYRESSNCRLELEFARGRKKPIVFLMCDAEYLDPTGWLGLLVRG